MRHLTDEEIQSYLQSGRTEECKLIEDHLNTCPECRNQLLLYKRLGEIVLSTTRKPTPNDFERAVMKRLTSIQRQRRITDLLVAITAIFGILTVGTAVLLAPQLKQSVAGYFADVWYHMVQSTSGSGGTAEYLAVPLFGVVLLLLFAVIDRKIMASLKTAKEARV